MTEELNNDVKKLRFLDEDGQTYPDWEEKQLREVAKVIGGGTPSTEKDEFWNGDVNWFSPAEIKSKYSQNSIKKITQEGLDKSSAKMLPVGTVLVTTRATLGRMSILEKEASTNQGFQNVITDNSLNNQFFYYQQPLVEKFCIAKAGGSTFKEISKNEFVKYQFSFPSLLEQTKIADFLSNLDERIEAQSKLVELLKKQKQGYSQKIFNGSLRFKKDDGTDYEDWEEKKLGEVGKIEKGSNSPTSVVPLKDSVNPIKVYNSGTGVLGYTRKANKEKESIIISGYGANAGHISFSLDPFWLGALGFAFNHGQNKLYMYQLIKSIEKRVRYLRQGTGIPYLMEKDIVNLTINLPSLPEQEKIAAFLSSLDNRIDQQLNKLEQLKQEKQAYMQRMLG